MKAHLIGEVGVDSGHLIIIDPGMVNTLGYDKWYTGNGVSKEIAFPSAVSFVSGEGDGDYPVYAIFDNENDFIGVIVWFNSDVKFPFEIEGSEEIKNDPTAT